MVFLWGAWEIGPGIQIIFHSQQIQRFFPFHLKKIRKDSNNLISNTQPGTANLSIPPTPKIKIFLQQFSQEFVYLFTHAINYRGASINDPFFVFFLISTNQEEDRKILVPDWLFQNLSKFLSRVDRTLL